VTATTPQALGATSADEVTTGVDSRFARLTEQVAKLRTRAGTGDLDRYMLVVGGILMPLGVLLIVLGWAGASRTPLPFEQTSYLISGGILGLGLVIAGGFVYFGYWQTVRIRESRVQSAELNDAMNRLETLLAGGAMVAIPEAAAGGSASRSKQKFVATANGSIFHRPDCAVVRDRDGLVSVDPDNTKLSPCRICTPLDE
jgi:hypothetical protein